MEYNDKIDILREYNEEAIVFNDIEDALVGVVIRIGMDPIAVYDYDKVIQCLMDGEDTEEAHEAAIEWFEYNTIGTWAGDGTPCFVHFFEKEEPQVCRFSTVLNNWWTRIVTGITAIQARCGRWWRRDGN